MQLRTLIRSPELHAGLLFGAVALAIGVVIVTLLRARGSGRAIPAGLAGPAVVVATLGALTGPGPFDSVGPVPARVVFALAGLWIAGEVGSWTGPPIGVVLALAAGVALVDSPTHAPAWVVAILVVGPALAGTATADFDRRASRTGLGPQLMLISIAGLYATVPDTELVLVLLGAMVPITFLAWPRVFSRLGSGGAYAAIGLYLWISALEGAPRPGSIVGAVAALGVLIAEPIGRLVASRLTTDRPARSPTAGRVNAAGFVVAQLLLAVTAARVVGRVDDPVVALVLALPGLAIGVAVGARAALGTPGTRTRSRPGDTPEV